MSLVLIASVLAFGATPRWAWPLLVAGSSALFMSWLLELMLATRPVIVWSPVALVFVGAVLLVGAQMWMGISPDRYGTREALLKIAGYAVIYWLTLQLWGRGDHDSVIALANAVIVFGAAIAMFAICQYAAQPETVYGHRFDGSPFGPYVNHNHFAGLMELIFPVTLASLVNANFDKARLVLAGSAAVLMLIAVVLSGSRGGVFSVAIGTVLVLGVASSSRRWKFGGVVLAVILLVALSAFELLDAGTASRRYREVVSNPEATLVDRKLMARDAFHLWMEHPVTGAGFGSYSVAILQKNSVVGERAVNHAHNDYLELLAEGGILGGILALGGLALVCFSLHSRLQVAASYSDHLILAFGIGCVSLLIHSVADFNLHVPANASWFAAFLAIATSPISATISNGMDVVPSR